MVQRGNQLWLGQFLSLPDDSPFLHMSPVGVKLKQGRS